jgi:nitrogen fixation/metabolism regulation signal transduction histidine kinase
VIRRAVLALLLAVIGAGAVLFVAGRVSDEARTHAARSAEDEADRRADELRADIDAYLHDPSRASGGGGLVGVERVPHGASLEEHPGEIVRRVTTIGTTDIVQRTRYALPPAEPGTFTWLFAVLAGLALGALGFVGAAGGAQRDASLEAAVTRVGEGDLDVTLDGSSPTASAFNRMTRELKEARTRLARAERIAAWRDIARRIAHEIKNPLTPIKMAMETLRKTHARKHPDFDEIFDESTKTVLEETARLEKIVTEFSRFARMPRPKAESVDVREIAEKVVALHDLGAASATVPETAKGVRVELAGDAVPDVRADREQLVQVLTNLVQNACDAAKEKQGEQGGRVIVRVAREDGTSVRVDVDDNGPGIPEPERDAVLEPYYTTKAHGTGLGLAIVDRIVSDHGGTLTLGTSDALGGARVSFVLRREGPPEEADASVGR